MRRSLAALTALLLVAAAPAARWAWPEGSAHPPVPSDNPMSTAKVELGRRLFYDADLSADGSMSCATCHEQHRGFADGNRAHLGVHGDPARRNVPGLANVGWMSPLTWGDPRLRRLEDQALVPVAGTSPIEMGMHGREVEIAARLAKDPCYVEMFHASFSATDGRIDMRSIAQALGAFERTLIANGSAFDQARRGGPPLPPLAERGKALFDADCASCHKGPNFSDSGFHRILPVTAADRGLGEITNRSGDDGKFRTPGLRNVAVTGPWLHDGSAPTLADAIGRHGVERPAADVQALVAFLGTLTDQDFLRDPRFSLPDQACGKPL